MIDETYIEMCRKAEEIQELWKPKSGDMIIITHSIFGEEIDGQIWDNMDSIEILVREVRSDNSWWTGTNKEGGSICIKGDELYTKTCKWLPRQEDLQEIVVNNSEGITASEYKEPGRLLYYFYSYQKRIRFNVNVGITIRWLCFVMETCYGKRWDSEKHEWVK
jgi:hypothetical protein